MKMRTILAVAVAAAACGPVEASRKVDAPQYLEYSTPAPGTGVRLYLDAPPGGPDELVFVYAAPAGEVRVSADVTAIQFDQETGDGIWLHAAADADLSGAVSSARLFVNGVEAASDTGPAMGPAVGGASLFAGGAPGMQGLYGDLHDICLIDNLWGTEVEAMAGCGLTPCISAIDAVTTAGTAAALFNPRLRRT